VQRLRYLDPEANPEQACDEARAEKRLCDTMKDAMRELNAGEKRQQDA
jgi:hypothetical protein